MFSLDRIYQWVKSVWGNNRCLLSGLYGLGKKLFGQNLELYFSFKKSGEFNNRRF
jgi:hypothetical protein